MDRSISPPRSRKRRRLSDSTTHSTDKDKTFGSTITVYSWNVNGISPFVSLQPSVESYFKTANGSSASVAPAQASLRDFLLGHNWPTLLFLQEVKINPDDNATLRSVERAVRRHLGEPNDAYDYEAYFCLPSDRFNARGFGRKVYGVCSIIRKDFKETHVEKIRPVSWDAEGRFLVIETKPIGNIPRLAIFNVYLVNGTDNAYKDPETGVVAGTRHDRKLAVHKLLQAECRKLEAEGFGIIIAGDINIASKQIDGHPNLRTFPKQHSINRADFEDRFFSAAADGNSSQKISDAGLNMIDTFRQLHPDKKSYTYYPRTKGFGVSCDRVDMILASSSLKLYVKAAGMHETPSARGPSDHVPVYTHLDFGEDNKKHDA